MEGKFRHQNPGRRMGPMRRGRWLWVAALAWLSGGCCAYPGLFEKVHESMVTVQRFYEPLIKQDLDRNEIARQAVVAADTTLLLAAELQEQWCPNPNEAGQLELQACEAKKLAREAGVVEVGASQDQTVLKGAE
jgi:hypothetical protein